MLETIGARLFRRKTVTKTVGVTTMTFVEITAEPEVTLPTYEQLHALADIEELRYPKTAFFLREAAAHLVHRQEHSLEVT